jgi:hypothetical protein
MEQEIESLRNISDEELDNQIRVLSKILFTPDSKKKDSNFNGYESRNV